MSCQKRTIRELIADVTAELIRLKYSELSMRISYSIPWNRFLKYADAQNELYFTEDLGEQYLSEKYQYPENYSGGLPDGVKRNVRCIRILGDFQAHNAILRARKRVFRVLPQSFQPLVPLIEEFAQLHEYTKSSIVRMNETLHTFFWYLENNQLTSLNEVTSRHLSRYIASKVGYSNATVSRDVSTLRSILKFFHSKNMSNSDLSEVVPKVRRLRRQTIPSNWSKDEVERILSVVDRGNPTGKRDYAILLLVSKLGLRESDVINLKLDDIYWDKLYIEFRQKKTVVLLRLPLLNDVGEAIIDYYRYGRPITDCQNVFVKHCAPLNEFINMGFLMRKYTSLAGVENANHAKGLHSLRHTLASRLLEEKVPIITISEILGHSDIHTTNDYLHVDIENLKKCAINPSEVISNV